MIILFIQNYGHHSIFKYCLIYIYIYICPSLYNIFELHGHLSWTYLFFLAIGNPRGNENPFLLTFGILWFRYHNFWAEKIQKEHPKWTDEQVFNEARKWVIASHQVWIFSKRNLEKLTTLYCTVNTTVKSFNIKSI